jgi:hypothetical protein
MVANAATSIVANNLFLFPYLARSAFLGVADLATVRAQHSSSRAEPQEGTEKLEFKQCGQIGGQTFFWNQLTFFWNMFEPMHGLIF